LLLLSGPFEQFIILDRLTVRRWNTAIIRIDRVFESLMMDNFLGFAVRKLILLVICLNLAQLIQSNSNLMFDL